MVQIKPSVIFILQVVAAAITAVALPVPSSLDHDGQDCTKPECKDHCRHGATGSARFFERFFFLPVC